MAELDGSTTQLARAADDAEDLIKAPSDVRTDDEPADRTGDDAGVGSEEESEDGTLETVAEQRAREARRARRAATASGAVLTLAGTGASAIRFSSGAPASAALAYAIGAVICATVAVLGARGRTKRALVGLIAGVLVMAIGDQLD
jgi:hypothetical protein